jgi:hypothetical protein
MLLVLRMPVIEGKVDVAVTIGVSHLRASIFKPC